MFFFFKLTLLFPFPFFFFNKTFHFESFKYMQEQSDWYNDPSPIMRFHHWAFTVKSWLALFYLYSYSLTPNCIILKQIPSIISYTYISIYVSISIYLYIWLYVYIYLKAKTLEKMHSTVITPKIITSKFLLSSNIYCVQIFNCLFSFIIFVWIGIQIRSAHYS